MNQDTLSIDSTGTLLPQLKTSIKVLPTPTKDEGLAISAMAKHQKEAGNTAEQAIKIIEDTSGIPASKSEHIVKKIFGSKVNADGISRIEVVEKCILDYGSFRFNLITSKVEIDGRPIEDQDVNDIYRIYSARYPYISTEMIWKLLGSHLLPKYNPFGEFFEKYKDRKPTDTIKKMTDVVGMDEFPAQMFRRWMIGLIECMNGGFSDIMFILCGTKGWRKTTFWRDLLPDELKNYFLSASLGDLGSGTERRDFMIRLSTVLLFCDDEMSGQGKRDQKFLKALMSVEKTLVRASHAREDKSRNRITCFCGTSNTVEILNDPEGNRRYIPFLLPAPIDKNELKAIDRIDLLMEAYWAWKNKEEWRIDPETNKTLDEHTGQFEVVTMEHELLLKHFEVDPVLVAQGKSGEWDFVDILKHLEDTAHGGVKHINVPSLRAAIRKAGFTSKQGSFNNKKARFYRTRLICKM
jgi:Virulence-associated protein E